MNSTKCECGRERRQHHYRWIDGSTVEVRGSLDGQCKAFRPVAKEDKEGHELLPCPFCGSKAEVRSARLPKFFSKTEFFVTCTKLGVCHGKHERTNNWGFTYREDAVRLWNTRTSLRMEEPETVPADPCRKVCATRAEYVEGRCTLDAGHVGRCHDANAF